jgi:hypothetical protein
MNMTVQQFNVFFTIVGIGWVFVMTMVVWFRYRENRDKMRRNVRNMMLMRTVQYRQRDPQDVLGSRNF